MALSFPNESRSYDARQHCVRFWAYDGALEVPFFVEADALRHMDPNAARDERGLLETFDRCRSRILASADRIYSRRRHKGSYTLAAADVK